jgi:hypothetical protein
VLEDIDERVVKVISNVNKARFSDSPISKNPLRNPDGSPTKYKNEDTIVLDIKDHEEQYDKR